MCLVLGSANTDILAPVLLSLHFSHPPGADGRLIILPSPLAFLIRRRDEGTRCPPMAAHLSPFITGWARAGRRGLAANSYSSYSFFLLFQDGALEREKGLFESPPSARRSQSMKMDTKNVYWKKKSSTTTPSSLRHTNTAPPFPTHRFLSNGRASLKVGGRRRKGIEKVG